MKNVPLLQDFTLNVQLKESSEVLTSELSCEISCFPQNLLFQLPGLLNQVKV